MIVSDNLDKEKSNRNNKFKTLLIDSKLHLLLKVQFKTLGSLIPDCI